MTLTLNRWHWRWFVVSYSIYSSFVVQHIYQHISLWGSGHGVNFASFFIALELRYTTRVELNEKHSTELIISLIVHLKLASSRYTALAIYIYQILTSIASSEWTMSIGPILVETIVTQVSFVYHYIHYYC